MLAGSAAAQHVLTTITTGRGPTDVLYDSIDRRIFVSNRGSGTVSVIDPNSNVVTATIPVGEGANAMCWSKTSDKIFVACAPTNGNGWVYIIDAAANQVIGSVVAGLNPSAIAWCSSRNKVYCVNMSPGGPISVIGGADFDSGFGKDVPVIPIPGQSPNAIVYNPTSDRIYVSSATNMAPGIVWVINPENDNIEASVTCGYSAWDLAVNPLGNRVYCSNRGSETVAVIDCASNQRLTNMGVEDAPHPLCWIPTDKLFIGEYWNHSVAFLQGESLQVSSRFPVSGTPGSMVYLEPSERLYVANYLSNSVSACDARNGHEQELVVVPVGSGPLGMAVVPTERHVYVANSWDSTVTVISDEMAAPISESPGTVPAAAPVVRAYPNPVRAGGELRFEFGGFSPSVLTVRDAAGRLVRSSVVHGSSSVVPAHMPAGVYFCSASDGRRTATCRFTVR